MVDILIVGGGPAGLTAALYGRRAGKSVLVLEKNTFGGQISWSPKVENYPAIASVSGLELADLLTARENIQMIRPASVTALHGNDVLEGITVREQDTERTYSVQGLFLAIGHLPQNALFSDLLLLDEAGYAAIGESCTTPTPGLFVAGDCRAKSVRQLTTAVSDGAVATLAACHYLDMQEG